MMIIMLLSMIVTMPANAKIKFGLRGGYNMVDMKWKLSEISSDNKTGFYIGPAIKIGTPILDFDLAALYDQCDMEVEGVRFKDKNMNLQFNVRKGFGFGDKLSVFVFAGPQFGFNIGDKKFSFSNANDYKMKDSNLSLNLGAGIRLVSHLEIGFNYNIALGKTGEFNEVDGAKNLVGNGKANAWQISAAYYF